jgi:hypothetical protein
VLFEVSHFEDEGDMARHQFVGGKGRWPGGASLHLCPSTGGQATAARGVMALGVAAVVVPTGGRRQRPSV